MKLRKIHELFVQMNSPIIIDKLSGHFGQTFGRDRRSIGQRTEYPCFQSLIIKSLAEPYFNVAQDSS